MKADITGLFPMGLFSVKNLNKFLAINNTKICQWNEVRTPK